MNEQEVTTSSAGPEQVGLSFLALAHSVRERVDRHMTTATGLSLSRAKVLQVLAGRGPLHQAELAKALEQAPRSVTQIVEGLERLDLVTRTGDSHDRRRKTVSVTDKGRAVLASAEQAGAEMLQQLFGSLDRRQLAALDQLVARVGTAVY
ncbi:MarR family winged helix-turn-helix transcriptional regulator [Streptomyces olivaceoviridis]|uniref:MarR family winged helix-turn-helix transcriptional regulator n=1 Tax=Streptomyces olivaceoviridis TaxID=1921 RepID=UPI0033AD93AF